MTQIANGMASIIMKNGNVFQIIINEVPKEPAVLHIPYIVDGVQVDAIGDGESSIVQFDSKDVKEAYSKVAENLITIECDDRISKVNPLAFEGVMAKEVHWPANCQIIPSECFANSKINKFSGMENVAVIERAAFLYTCCCKEIRFSDNLATIEENAFELSEFENIYVGNNVGYIGVKAFRGSNLKSFVWPASTTIIPDFCFACCQGLISIDNTEAVTEIGEFAFGCCKNMTSFDFPQVLRKIGETAFAISGIKEADLSGTLVEEIGLGAFFNAFNLERLTVNIGCIVSESAIKKTKAEIVGI